MKDDMNPLHLEWETGALTLDFHDPRFPSIYGGDWLKTHQKSVATPSNWGAAL
jgi:hypothetical protein